MNSRPTLILTLATNKDKRPFSSYWEYKCDYQSRAGEENTFTRSLFSTMSRSLKRSLFGRKLLKNCRQKAGSRWGY